MNLKPYIAKQEQLEQYRANLDIIEEQLAHAGGEMAAPISLINHRKSTLDDIARVEKELQQIELRMIEEIPTIRGAFKDKDKDIAKCQSEINSLRQTYAERDRRLGELSWTPTKLRELTQQQRKKAYEEAQGFTRLVAAYGDELGEDYKSGRRGLNRIIKRIIEEYTEFLMNMKKYYQ